MERGSIRSTGLEVRLRNTSSEGGTALAWVEDNEESACRDCVLKLRRLRNDWLIKQVTLMTWSDREKSLSATQEEREAQRAAATRALGETESKLQRAKMILEGICRVAGKEETAGRESPRNSRRLKKTKLEVQQSAKTFAGPAAEGDSGGGASAECPRLGPSKPRVEKLSGLVGVLEDHIEGGVCPACGQDHGSRRRIAGSDFGSVEACKWLPTSECRGMPYETRIKELNSSIEEVERRR